MSRGLRVLCSLAVAFVATVSCNKNSDSNSPTPPEDVSELGLPETCGLVSSGHGPRGTSAIRVEKIVTGLDVPWGIGFISPSDYLVSERSGRVRIVRSGVLDANPVFNLDDVSPSAEGGLLGLAIHPEFASNRYFYLYYTADRGERGRENRVARYRLASDGTSAAFDQFIVTGIPAGTFHDGGRIRFGPDGMLYVGTGDARVPELSQDITSFAGKVLRLDPNGVVPLDNPFHGSAIYLMGVRNVQAFDWLDSTTLVVADHGPSGELGRSGHDELSFAKPGENLGWPEQWRCDRAEGRRAPFLVWREATPPGGLVHYTGSAIPEWRGSIVIATLGSRHLQRVSFERDGDVITAISHEVYLEHQFGRLREVVQAPDGSLLVTTSNCDGRGTCGPERDVILRITSP